MKPQRANRSRHVPRQDGVALVLTLAFVVLLTFIIVAFFSRAVLDRRISGGSTAQVRAEMVAEGAMEMILTDLRREIAAGSEILEEGGVTIFLPDYDDPSTMVPARALATGSQPARPLNLIKRSGHDVPFFSGGAYDSATFSPSNFASDLATARLQDGEWRGISPQRWNAPRLMTNDELDANFILPDWVYVSRSGPVRLTEVTPGSTNNEPDNQAYVVGRYAYTVYDVSGLLDINVAGNLLDEEENARRGRLHQARLAALRVNGEQVIADPAALVGWRNPLTGADDAWQAGSGGLFDPERDFIQVVADAGTEQSDQAFLGRQDLIRYQQENPGVLLEDALPFLTVFTRELNAPSWRPDPDRPRVDRPFPQGPDDLLNPSLFEIRDASGNLVVDRRFSLGDLDLLRQYEEGDLTVEDRIFELFGLEPELVETGDQRYLRWNYRGGSVNRIMALDEVADEGRAPDFFELLQAAILTGSLGAETSETSYLNSPEIDANIYYQVMRIGANIIDQFDNNNFPTAIVFNEVEFYGIENLPYISEVSQGIFRSGNDLQHWFIFEVWNPHQNAAVIPEIEQFRIRALRGNARMEVHYWAARAGTIGGDDPGTINRRLRITTRTYGDSNDMENEPPIVFSANLAYEEPVTLGYPNSPNEEGFLGILSAVTALPEYAIPPREEQLEHPARDTWDGIAEGLTEDPSSYLGAKYHNRAIFNTSSREPPVFVLEMLVNGRWRPYQEVGEFGNTTSQYNPPPEESVDTLLDDATVIPYSEWTKSVGEDATGPDAWATGALSDPRVTRFGMSYSLMGSATPNASTFTFVDGEEQWQSLRAAPGGSIQLAQADGSEFLPAGFAKNNPGGPNSESPIRYSDPDGVVRGADGVLGATPTVAGNLLDRSPVLNRPPRSVGELGYVSRDVPWRSLDFFSSDSADAALLDFFGMGTDRVIGGRVNLNSARPEVIAAVIEGSLLNEGSGNQISSEQADSLATALRDLVDAEPLRSRAELATRYAENVLGSATRKTEVESMVRALAEPGNTRTWNLLVDVVAQSGRLGPAANSLDDFQVEGEQRVWLHLAIDRFTGEVLSQQIETVYE